MRVSFALVYAVRVCIRVGWRAQICRDVLRKWLNIRYKGYMDVLGYNGMYSVREECNQRRYRVCIRQSHNMWLY